MIKINLIGEGRKPVATKKRSTGLTVGGGDTGAADMVLWTLCILGVLFALGHFLWVRQQVSSTKKDVKVAKEEVDRLAPIIREVEEFKAKKAELERKVDVINTLKRNQRGPVQIMDEVSRAVPELLWLRRMDLKGNNLKISGQAYNNNAVASFIANLDKVPEFSEPILRDSQRRGEAFNFIIDVAFNLRPPAAEGDEAVASGG